VAVHAELCGVIFALNRLPDETVRTKAVEEGIALYATPASAFDVVGRLYELGLRGPHT
jgi:phosphotransferase system IIA component